MGIFGKKQSRRRGFTITELLIVISVIGILASVAFVAYPQYQKSVRDAERKSDLSQLAAAMSAYALKKNNYMTKVIPASQCGLFGDGNGWISLGNSDGGGFYPRAITECLQDAGVITNANDFIDPLGCKADSGGVCGGSGQPAQAYMKATCTKSGQPITYFMAHLEREPLNNVVIDALCDPNSMDWFSATSQKWGTSYGMNYYVVAK